VPERGLLFNTIAEDYDRVRPTYPAALVDRACAGLTEGARVLEVGCGTGKLTRELAHRGFRLAAVEPGPAMMDVARRSVGNAVTFHLGRFEDVELPAGAYDAVFSATAFHWVDPRVGWAKVAWLLRPGGTFALLTHLAGNTGPVDRKIREAWLEVRPEIWPQRSIEELLEGARARRADISEVWAWLNGRDLAAPGTSLLFEDADIETEARDVDETADEVLAHVRTSSAFLELPPDRREWLEGRFQEIIGAAGGYRNTIYAVLVTARAVPAGP
jgi:SAM-dependent methyltransferase